MKNKKCWHICKFCKYKQQCEWFREFTGCINMNDKLLAILFMVEFIQITTQMISLSVIYELIRRNRYDI